MFLFNLMLLSASPVIIGLLLLVGTLYAAKISRRRAADKRAQLQLLSNNVQELEKYLNEHVNQLSDGMVKQLIKRLESLKEDELLDEDLIVKRRIEALPVSEETETMEEESVTQPKKVTM